MQKIILKYNLRKNEIFNTSNCPHIYQSNESSDFHSSDCGIIVPSDTKPVDKTEILKEISSILADFAQVIAIVVLAKATAMAKNYYC